MVGVVCLIKIPDALLEPLRGDNRYTQTILNVLFPLLYLLKRFSGKNRLFTPLYTSFLLLVLLLLVQGVLNVFIKVLHQQTFDWVNDSLLIERETERLLSSALDEQTTVRGYLITKEAEFLESYKNANSAFGSSFNRLYTLVKDNPTQTGQLNDIKAIHDRWQSQFVQRVFAGTASKTTLPGKILFDPMRGIVKSILKHEQKVLGDRQQQLRQIYNIQTALNIFNIVVVLAGVGWNLWYLRRRVEIPLRQLTFVGGAWREGRLDVRLDYSSPDEIGRLAVVLDAMAEEIRDRQQSSHLRNQQLEDLISALSHDLRTPLLATRNTLRPMLNGAFGSVSDTWKEILEEYRDANEDLLGLVDALLDISRYEAGGIDNLNWEQIDWEKICTQAINSCGAIGQRQYPIILKIAPSLPTIYGDQLEIKRVVQNLLDNAVRVSEPDLPIVIEVTPLGVAYIKLSVSDKGSGIAPQEKEKLFHRFIQGRNRRGRVGLGLYLCRQIVVAHGGTINVESKLGEGSTFWFTLPVIPGSRERGSKK